MGIHVETDERVVRFVFEGATAARDVYAVFHRAFGAAAEDHQTLVDLRASTSLADRTPEFVRMLTEFVIEHPERPGSRLAVVLPPEERPRWMDLVASISSGSSVDVQLFDTPDEAAQWLVEDD